MLSRTSNAGTPSATTVSWTYDEARSGYANVGHLTTMTDPFGSETSNYDALGRRVQWTRNVTGSTYSFQEGYDAGGRILSLTFPDGDTEGTSSAPMTYDGAGRLYSIPGIVNSVTYTAEGRLLTQANANGTSTTRTLTGRGFITNIATTLPGGVTEQKLNYTFDGEGKITQVTSPFCNESWSYTYDDLHELTSAMDHDDLSKNQGLSYDAQGLGNMTSNSLLGSYNYPAAGQSQPHAVLSAGANTYSYDAAGEMLSGAGRTYSWDGEARVSGVNGWTYNYDGNGRRLQKISPSGAVTTYLGDNYEISSGGQVTKYFAIGSVLIAKRVGNGTGATTYWLHVGTLGSINTITNGSGQEIYRMKYLPFGDRLETDTNANTPAGFAESRGYTAQRQDETGLFYLHARYYDPQLARFVSPDPTTPGSRNIGLNHYEYASNNPITYEDVSGLRFAADGGDWASGGSSSAVIYGDADYSAFDPAVERSYQRRGRLISVTGTGGATNNYPGGNILGKVYDTPAAGWSPIGLLRTGLGLIADTGFLGLSSDMGCWSPQKAQQILADHNGSLQGYLIQGHSAGSWSTILAGVQGGADEVNVYGCPGNVYINVQAGTKNAPQYVYIPDHSCQITINGVRVNILDDTRDPVPKSGPLCSDGTNVMSVGQYRVYQRGAGAYSRVGRHTSFSVGHARWEKAMQQAGAADASAARGQVMDLYSQYSDSYHCYADPHYAETGAAHPAPQPQPEPDWPVMGCL